MHSYASTRAGKNGAGPYPVCARSFGWGFVLRHLEHRTRLGLQDERRHSKPHSEGSSGRIRQHLQARRRQPHWSPTRYRQALCSADASSGRHLPEVQDRSADHRHLRQVQRAGDPDRLRAHAPAPKTKSLVARGQLHLWTKNTFRRLMNVTRGNKHGRNTSRTS